MTVGGRAVFDINTRDFNRRLSVLLHHVETGTRKATTAAAQEILDMSLQEVPRDTDTLAQSAGFQILGKYRNFEAVIAYGMNGDPVNPRTGQRASEYMVKVHEDLSAQHTTGKAKFLEDPVRRYQLAAKAAAIIRREAGM